MIFEILGGNVWIYLDLSILPQVDGHTDAKQNSRLEVLDLNVAFLWADVAVASSGHLTVHGHAKSKQPVIVSPIDRTGEK